MKNIYKFLSSLLLIGIIVLLQPVTTSAATKNFTGTNTINSTVDLIGAKSITISGQEYMDGFAKGYLNFTLKDKNDTAIYSTGDEWIGITSTNRAYTWISSTKTYDIPLSGYDLSSCSISVKLTYTSDTGNAKNQSVSAVVSFFDPPICATNLPAVFSKN